MEKEKKIKKKALSAGYLILASAIVWGAVIVGCSLKLRGTECYQEISNILIGGVLMHLILIWGPMGVMIGKNKKKTDDA